MYKRRQKLEVIAIDDNAKIIEIQPKSEICKQYRVVFDCFCGERYSKQVNDVCGKKSTGLFCYAHSLERRRRVKLQTALDEGVKNDNATYKKEDVQWGERGHVKFMCFCGVEHVKLLCAIQKGQGMFCKEHTKVNTRTKSRHTSIIHYGTDHPQQSSIIKQQVKESNLEKYGVEYLAHVAEIHDKQHKYRFKDYYMPSGEIRKIQGYENLALDELLQTYDESKITTKRFAISYVFEGKKCCYYPDIVLEDEPRKIIEVKSEYTMHYPRFYSRNIAKRDACVQQGFLFEFWVYDNKKFKTVLN